jgi:hypothetical protein
MTYTQRLLFPPPTIRMSVCLYIIAAIVIMGLALRTHSRNEHTARSHVHALQHPST